MDNISTVMNECIAVVEANHQERTQEMKEPGPPAKNKSQQASRGHDEVNFYLEHALEEIKEAQSMWSSPRACKECIVVRLYTVIRIEETDRRPTEEKVAETKEAETDSKNRECPGVSLKGSDESTAQTSAPRYRGSYGRPVTL